MSRADRRLTLLPLGSHAPASVPIWNETHDKLVLANKEDYRKKGIQRRW
jgi:hypothetical protein